MTDRADHILVVEDDDSVRRVVVRLVRKYRPVRDAGSVEEAISLLGSHRDWCGFVVDVALARHIRGGFDVLEEAMALFPGLPAAVITGSVVREVVNRATAIGAMILAKPFREPELLPFIQQVTAREHGLDESFAKRLDSLSRAWRLTPREHEILAWFVSGGTRESFLSEMRIAETTLKSHVKHMLEKTKADSLGDLVSEALRRSMESGKAAAPRAPSSSRIKKKKH